MLWSPKTTYRSKILRYVVNFTLLWTHLKTTTNYDDLRFTSHTTLKAHYHCSLRSLIAWKAQDRPGFMSHYKVKAKMSRLFLMWLSRFKEYDYRVGYRVWCVCVCVYIWESSTIETCHVVTWHVQFFNFHCTREEKQGNNSASSFFTF